MASSVTMNKAVSSSENQMTGCFAARMMDELLLELSSSDEIKSRLTHEILMPALEYCLN